mgnify:FL=1
MSDSPTKNWYETQLSLPVPPPSAKRRTIAERWAEFHQRNPHVYAALETLALRKRASGELFGVKALWEECRYELQRISAVGAYKLNNDFTALYARELIRLHPSLAAVLEVRKRKAA